MFNRKECAFYKFEKGQIKFKEFLKEATLLEVSELLLLYISYILLIIFTIGICCIPILPILCNTNPTLGVKFFHILFGKVIYPSAVAALIISPISLGIYYIFFAEGE